MVYVRPAGKRVANMAMAIADLLGYLHGIGPDPAIDKSRARLPARRCSGCNDPAIGRPFYRGDVAHANCRAVGIGAQDDVGKFLRTRQTAPGLEVDLNLLFV